ncbi:peptide chain release factor N(5)-glutamine methyltransferase [Oricola cellulosilytica]|uniref:Release factor glutamine methyltransferase n=2 Tax=Oricola cellulosilytica TaxID=1429082 RepID=A0A4R0PC13_9HYPH|nr:peptide chain release factor N(5)-glutamine methyltransferase [Oricola cellulosilytica]
MRFAEAGLPTPDLDASLLLEFAAGITVLSRMREPDLPVGSKAAMGFEVCVARRLRREPVHRIIGQREFYGLPLGLNKETLVPRPDTETLVDLVMPLVESTVAGNAVCRILDIGTGSGAIALALLANVQGAVAVGSDISRGALTIAERNAAQLGLGDRFEAVVSNWFENISGTFDLIVSNPPYIRSGEIAALDPDVRDYDPLAALDGGGDGLNAYGVLAARAAAHLTDNGAVAVEIGHDQKRDVLTLFEAAGMRKSGEKCDFSGHDRALIFVK